MSSVQILPRICLGWSSIHAGIAASTILTQYERERAITFARWLAGIEEGEWPPKE